MISISWICDLYRYMLLLIKLHVFCNQSAYMDICGRQSVHPLVAITLVHLFDVNLSPLDASRMHSDLFLNFFFLGVIGLNMKFRGASTCMFAENTWGRMTFVLKYSSAGWESSIFVLHMIQSYRSLWTYSFVHRTWIIFHTKVDYAYLYLSYCHIFF